MKEKMYSPAEVGNRLGVSVRTIQRWDKEGKIKVIRTLGNQRRIPESEIRRIMGNALGEGVRCAIYARVSSQKQIKEGNLERQKERLLKEAKERGYKVVRVIMEKGSGLNENRKGLKKLFKEASREEIDKVLIEYKDRLARFGYSYIEKAFEAMGVKIEIVEEEKKKEPSEELMKDLLSIITVFSARIYGSRAQVFKQKVNEVIKECGKGNGRSQENNEIEPQI